MLHGGKGAFWQKVRDVASLALPSHRRLSVHLGASRLALCVRERAIMSRFALVAALVAHGAVAFGRGRAGAQAGTTDAPEASQFLYTNNLGPELPGLGDGACKVTLRPLGVSGADGDVITFDSWLAQLQHALVTQDASVYDQGISTLCGSRNVGENDRHKELPTTGTAMYRVLTQSVEIMTSACETGNANAYASAFDIVCPQLGAVGPAMPERCDAVLPDPTAETTSTRRLQLSMFFSRLQELLRAEKPDDQAWRRGMQSLCGSKVDVGGAGFHSHRPMAGTSTFNEVATGVRMLANACGAAERDVEAYQRAWMVLCPASPEVASVVLAADAKPAKVPTYQERLVAAIASVQADSTKLRPLLDAAKTAIAAEQALPSGNAQMAEVTGLIKSVSDVEDMLAEWESADGARAVPVEKACDAEPAL